MEGFAGYFLLQFFFLIFVLKVQENNINDINSRNVMVENLKTQASHPRCVFETFEKLFLKQSKLS